MQAIEIALARIESTGSSLDAYPAHSGGFVVTITKPKVGKASAREIVTEGSRLDATIIAAAGKL